MTANTVAAKSIKTVLGAILAGIGIGVGFLIVDKTLRRNEDGIQQAPPPPAGYRRGGRGRGEEED